MNAVVEIKDLRVEYPSREMGQRTKVAVKGLSLRVNAGEVFGFLETKWRWQNNNNERAARVCESTGGSASIFGVDVRQPIARQRIGYLPELTYYYKFLNAEELLRFYAKIFNIPKNEREKRIDDVLKLVELEHARDTAHQNLFQRNAATGGFGAGFD